jgi:uncharacterized protein
LITRMRKESSSHGPTSIKSSVAGIRQFMRREIVAALMVAPRRMVKADPLLHPDTELRFVSPEIGVGVFATKPIPKGTIVWALDDLDQVLNPAFVDRLDDLRKELVLKYAYRNRRGQYVLCWDLAKFVNHSFHANCMGTAYDFEVAVRDIPVGEELTDDYGTLNLDEPFHSQAEAGTKRALAMPDDLLHFSDEWDRSVLEALACYRLVEQPLAYLVKPEFQAAVRTAVDEHILLDSIRATYFDRG